MEEKNTEESVSQREQDVRTERARRIRGILLILSVLAGIGLGLLLARNKPASSGEKLFQAEGFEITLADRFLETGDRGEYDRAYRSNRESLLVLELPFAEEPGLEELSVEDYAAKLTETHPGAELSRTQEGIVFLEYEEEGEFCLLSVSRGSGAFWQFRFSCKAGNRDKYREDFLKFAASVTVR